MRTIEMDIKDFIDVAIIILKYGNRDILDMYLSLVDGIMPDDIADYELISDDDYVGDSLNDLELILMEKDKWATWGNK